MKKISRRSFVKAAGSAAVLSMLAACGGSSSSTAASTASTAASTAGASSAAAASFGPDTQAIVDRGVLKVGVKNAVQGFSFQDTLTGEYKGLEDSLAEMIAEYLGVDVEFTTVTAATRGELLDSGDIDAVLATFTITEERKKSWDFTTPYYTDYVSVLVEDSNGIKDLADLKDKVVGVSSGSTSARALVKAMIDAGVLDGANFDADTFNADAKSLEAAIEAVLAEGKLTPKAVVDVDLFGLPADHEAVAAVCEKHGLLLLEDAAQGFGGMLHGKRNGAFGDAACTSFFPAKPLGCYGDGGAVFTDSDETAAMVRSLCVHGKGSFKYDNVRIGMNSRLDTIQAAILLVKMDAFEKYELADVNAAAAMYNEALAGIPAILPVVPEGWYSSWAQYTLRLRSREERDRVQAELKAQGIPTMVYYPKPMHTQQAFDGLKQYVPCPVTEELCATVLSLPMHPYLTRETVQTVTDALRRALK